MHLRSPDCYTRVLHMVLSMSRPTKHPKTGIYWLRRRIPADLVEKLGRREVTKSLETRDPDEAKRKHAALLLELDTQWTRLREGSRQISDRETHLLAKPVGDAWFSQFEENPSEQLLWHTEIYDGMWTRYPLPEVEAIDGVSDVADPIPGQRPIENIFWNSMRGRCFDEARKILASNNFADEPLSLLKVAKAVGAAIQQASLVLAEHERGNFDVAYAPSREPPARFAAPPSMGSAGSRPTRAVSSPAYTLSSTVEDWWREAKAAGRKPSTYESYRNTFATLVRYLGHDDLARVGVADVVGFKDHRLNTPSAKTGRIPSAKTVKDSDLSGLKAVFEWAVRNGRLVENPAANITIKLAKARRLRSKGFTDEEARAILAAATKLKKGNEADKTFAAKRWVPWLCAFTGARVGELCQLRKQDVFEQGGHWVIRITPEAGTVKTNEAREVPLHAQIIELGFPDFIAKAKNGHLFLNVEKDESPLGRLQGLKNRLADFGRSIVSDPHVAPNHGWRHRFKTVGMEADISVRILDAIQGQAPRSVADSYGDVTVKTMAEAIAKLPRYDQS